MKIISDSIDNDGMTSIIPAGAPRADIDIWAKNIDKFAFPLVTELSSEDDCCHSHKFSLEGISTPIQ